MSLAAGMRLGPYEIAAPLGSGAMGEVYRARDTRLGRDVAVKVLPAALARDEEHLRRFEVEARAASGLNHPNILAIHDVGTHAGAPYVVSELLEGETLRARLEHGPLPPHRALDFATQVARGLTAAHERGVVHRDLKPANLFVTRDGLVKLLDFGLAKLTHDEAARAVGGDGTALTTLTRGTTPGSVLGTVGYMSPEQVRGRPADHRSDIFSFGAVLYEMVTGRRAFHGDSAVETLNAIITQEPPEISSAGRPTPPGLDRVVRHCLEKRPEERFQSARDLVFDLETISGLTALGSSSPVAAHRGRDVSRRFVLRGAVATVAALVLAGTAFVAGRGSARSSAPSYRQITHRRGLLTGARFTPEGGAIVYSAAWDGRAPDVFSGRLDSPDALSLDKAGARLQAVARTGEMVVLHPSPDGLSTLARAPLAGGPLRDILTGVEAADWRQDGSEFAVTRVERGSFRLEYPIGRTLAQTSGRVSHPRLSPDGRRVAFIDHPLIHDDRGAIAVIDREGHRTVLSEGWGSAEGLAWTPDGSEVWFTASRTGALCGLHAVDLSGRLRAITTAPGRLVLHDISRDGRVLLSHNLARGEIHGRPPGAAEERSLSWHDFSHGADLSSDGRWLLFSESGEAGGASYGVYRRATDGSPAVRLGEGRPLGLSPDGAWALTVPLDEPARLVLLPTGAGERRTLSLAPLVNCQFAAWFPDGRRVLLLAGEAGRPLRLYVRDLERDEPPRPITPEGVGVLANTISPDGRVVLAFSFEQTPRVASLYPVDGGDPKSVPGFTPRDAPVRWSADGRALFVSSGGFPPPLRISRLDVATGRRTLLREITPADPAGVPRLGSVQMSADGAAYAYSLQRTLSTLFLVEGLR